MGALAPTQGLDTRELAYKRWLPMATRPSVPPSWVSVSSLAKREMWLSRRWRDSLPSLARSSAPDTHMPRWEVAPLQRRGFLLTTSALGYLWMQARSK